MLAKLSVYGPQDLISLSTRERLELYEQLIGCLLYTSDAADERSSVDLGGRRIIQKKKITKKKKRRTKKKITKIIQNDTNNKDIITAITL